MAKTFYSVTYWDGSAKMTKWFDNAEKANEFADHKYRDDPVRHTYKNPEKIKEVEEIIERQSCIW